MKTFKFHPAVQEWFEGQFGTPTEPQERGWPAIQSGAHVLISAPTGSGKTLAAFLAALDRLFHEAATGPLPDETRVLYVSPLKALSNDIHKNLEEPLSGIRSIFTRRGTPVVEVRAEVRTGDTPAVKRLAIAKKPPHILVTTPESFYLLLTSDSGRRLLRTVRTLIVDEVHALVNNRRGSHLALSMERLEALVQRPIQRIGLSATQKPIEEVARFLTGIVPCVIMDVGHKRPMDLAVELPGSPLEAVMSNEVWEEVYGKLADLIEQHRTTLVFVNTRRLAERVTHHLAERLGMDKVTSHHGSLSAKWRLDAENRLKRGELKALVATASLELGIDIGSVDLVCQLGPTRSIATLLQRVGRAEHKRGGLPKGRLFPLSRDELVECMATLRSARRGELDCLRIPEKPLDILAQQIVACAACEDWEEDALFDRMRTAYPYRNLTQREFDEVVTMLAEGFSTRRGRRGALIHHDAVNHRIRARRGARLIALTSGGAIPDNADYRVVLEPAETFLGTVNEDFAIESMTGDIFQLGNASWKILRIQSGMVRVEDARGQPPSIPFWLGEAPARTDEVSCAVSELRQGMENLLQHGDNLGGWLVAETGVTPGAAQQIAEYFTAAYQALGAIPSQTKLVMERFFDESGGMQLVIHSPFGSRINRAWGLALRKRFCRTFNFELQAAATDDAIVLSLGAQHSFPLEEVFRYLHSKTVRDVLVQALLDAPMFTIRWRWNAARALAVPRQRGHKRTPPPLQRMEAEDLVAAVFPDQLACLENIVGDREIPDHPLVNQSIQDCLTEAMDIDGLIRLLQQIEQGTVEGVARDLPEPSPLAYEILNAKPYAFLDNAPLEERRTQAVYTRRAFESSSAPGLGMLDPSAIELVCEQAWPRPVNADEMHDALLLLGVMTKAEGSRSADPNPKLGMKASLPQRKAETSSEGRSNLRSFLDSLARDNRAARLFCEIGGEGEVCGGCNSDGSVGERHPELRPGSVSDARHVVWVAAERLSLVKAIYEVRAVEPPVAPPEKEQARVWERAEAVRELLRGRLEVSGPISASELSGLLRIAQSEIEAALLALEGEGFILRGRFHPDAKEQEWCERRLLARIHKLTINRLRGEIQPVSIGEFCRFLTAWQRVDAEHRAEGIDGTEAVLNLFDGFELPTAAWEPEVLSARVKEYDPHWLDRLCFTGCVGWGRLSPPTKSAGRAFSFGPLRSSPIALYHRENLPSWLALCGGNGPLDLSPDTTEVLKILAQSGAIFFAELVRRSRLLPSQTEQALGELAALGLVTSDSFDGLRALLIPSHKKPSLADTANARRRKTVTSIEFAGRWSLLRPIAVTLNDGRATEERSVGTPAGETSQMANGKWRIGAAVRRGLPQAEGSERARENAIDVYARTLLRRYGVVFRRLLDRESIRVSWYELGRVYRRLEARGEIRGGHFVAGVSGEQFALPEAIGLLRSIRKSPARRELIALSGADPLNLVGILTPGGRITAVTGNRILLCDGQPIAALEAGQIVKLEETAEISDQVMEEKLKVGKLPLLLRTYYG